MRRHVAPPSADTSLRHRNASALISEKIHPHRIAVLVVAAEYDLVPSLAGDEAVHRIRSRAGPGGSPGIYARVVEPYDAPPFASGVMGSSRSPRGGQIQTS